jgi:hypothetical protein
VVVKRERGGKRERVKGRRVREKGNWWWMTHLLLAVRPPMIDS